MSSLLTLAIGSLGGSIAWFFGAPIPFLIGSAILVTLAALIGFNCSVNINLKNISFIAIGIAFGSDVNPTIFHNIFSWPITILGMILNVILMLFLASFIFQKFFSIDRNTAILASTPGHLSYVLSLSEDTNANSLLISVIQSIRVLTLTLAVPATIAIFSDYTVAPLENTGEQLSYVHLVTLVIFSVVIGYILNNHGFPAAFLIGGMVSSAFGHSLDWTPGYVPSFITVSAFTILGSLIGSRFADVKIRTLQKAGFQGLIFTLIALSLSILIAWVISNLSRFNFIEILIAIAPGGFEAMVAMGTFVTADPTFIAFHHLARLFLLSFIIPLVLKQPKTK